MTAVGARPTLEGAESQHEPEPLAGADERRGLVRAVVGLLAAFAWRRKLGRQPSRRLRAEKGDTIDRPAVLVAHKNACAGRCFADLQKHFLQAWLNLEGGGRIAGRAPRHQAAPVQLPSFPSPLRAADRAATASWQAYRRAVPRAAGLRR